MTNIVKRHIALKLFGAMAGELAIVLNHDSLKDFVARAFGSDYQILESVRRTAL